MDTSVVVLADPTPRDEKTLHAIAGVLQEELGLVAYDGLRRARDLRGILVENQPAAKAANIAAKLNAAGIIAGVADGSLAPPTDAIGLVRAVGVRPDGIEAQVGYYESELVPYGRIELISVCRTVEQSAGPARAMHRGAGTMFGSGGLLRARAEGGDTPRRVIENRARPDECFVADIHLRNPARILRIKHNACAFQHLGARKATYAEQNFQTMLFDLRDAAPGILFSPLGERFLSGDDLSDSLIGQLSEFELYNRWLFLAAIAFGGGTVGESRDAAEDPEELKEPDDSQEPMATFLADAPAATRVAAKPDAAPTRPAAQPPAATMERANVPHRDAAIPPGRSTKAEQPAAAFAPLPAKPRGAPPKPPGFSLLTFFIRWGMLVFGLLLLYGGAEKLYHYKPVSLKPETITLADLDAIFLSGEERYVSIKGELSNPAIYSSWELSEPPYALYPGHEIQPLFENNVLVESPDQLLGANVSARMRANPFRAYVLQWYQESGHDEAKTVVTSEKLLVQLLAGGRQVWALSPEISSLGLSQEKFLSQETFSGRLTRFVDIDLNRPKLAKNYNEIRQFLQGSGVQLPPDAFLILADSNLEGSRAQGPVQPYYLPVYQTGFKLFVRTNAQEEKMHWQPGLLTGILRVKNGAQFRDWQRMIEGTLPPVFGLLTNETPQERNQRELDKAYSAMSIGLFFTIIAGIWIAIRTWLYLQYWQAVTA